LNPESFLVRGMVVFILGSKPCAEEMHCLAGNAYNVRSVAAAYVCAMAVSDLDKFNQAVEERSKN